MKPIYRLPKGATAKLVKCCQCLEARNSLSIYATPIGVMCIRCIRGVK